MSRIRLVVVALATVAASLLLAAGAQARMHDRNHDRIPDRWEKRHHLSLHVNQARRDQDKDGLRDRGEFRAHLNPRDADTDNDGIEDGDENAGTIASFDNGVLTISLAGGGSITGKVTDATEIECEGSDHSSGDDESSDDRGDEQGDDAQGDDNDDQAGDDQGDDNDDQGDDDQGEDEDDQGEDCAANPLQDGTTVEEAELRLRNGTATFKELQLRP